MTKKSNSILVLGISGMLGSMVFDYLKRNKLLAVTGTLRKSKHLKKEAGVRYFDADEFIVNPKKYQWIREFDYIINCIGVIKPYCKDNDLEGVRRAIRINAWFPHVLAETLAGASTQVLSIATDCVYSGVKGSYTESDLHDPTDVYGKTKSLGEAFDDVHWLNIRCSIIGPELTGHLSLLDWFLSQKEGSEIMGFAHHQWNGVTTLQYAQLMERIITKNSFSALRSVNHVLHWTPNTSVNKFQLMKLFSSVFNRNLVIKKVTDIGPKVDRTLKSNYLELNFGGNQLPMKQALVDLKKYMEHL